MTFYLVDKYLNFWEGQKKSEKSTNFFWTYKLFHICQAFSEYLNFKDKSESNLKTRLFTFGQYFFSTLLW